MAHRVACSRKASSANHSPAAGNTGYGCLRQQAFVQHGGKVRMAEGREAQSSTVTLAAAVASFPSAVPYMCNTMSHVRDTAACVPQSVPLCKVVVKVQGGTGKIAMVGELSQLGSWAPPHGLIADDCGVVCAVLPVSTFEFKLAVHNGGEWVMEDGSNRRVDIPAVAAKMGNAGFVEITCSFGDTNATRCALKVNIAQFTKQLDEASEKAKALVQKREELELQMQGLQRVIAQKDAEIAGLSSNINTLESDTSAHHADLHQHAVTTRQIDDSFRTAPPQHTSQPAVAAGTEAAVPASIQSVEHAVREQHSVGDLVVLSMDSKPLGSTTSADSKDTSSATAVRSHTDMLPVDSAATPVLQSNTHVKQAAAKKAARSVASNKDGVDFGVLFAPSWGFGGPNTAWAVAGCAVCCAGALAVAQQIHLH